MSDPPPYVYVPSVPPARPLLAASPHSGAHYPDDLLAAARLQGSDLRASEDCFVDEIAADLPSRGVGLLLARVARAYLDVNRDPRELDPALFAEALPADTLANTVNIRAGLGVVPRVVASGLALYQTPPTLAEARRRIEALHRPYHQFLAEALADSHRRFGWCLLLDLHSMPSTAATTDIVLGDCHGEACAPAVIDAADAFLSDQGYRVARNRPYAGGYTTRLYGRPGEGRHALQIEINRRLYMDETRLERRPGLDRLKTSLALLAGRLADLPR
jgi:N-formylglutamate amidohydrolase